MSHFDTHREIPCRYKQEYKQAGENKGYIHILLSSRVGQRFVILNVKMKVEDHDLDHFINFFNI